MPSISSRTSRFTESVIREMTRLAEQTGAINLAQGYPDFDPPAELLAAAEQALRNGHHQYSITWGSYAFRQALAEKQSLWMRLELEPDAHITVTCGSTEAMLAALLAVCNPGERVIVFSPFYENYAADAILSGAEPVFVPLHPPAFNFDPAELRRAFQQGAKALVLCNPSNPCGKVFSRAELEVIAGLAQEYDAFVITDEVYEHIVYAPHIYTYIVSLSGMFTRTLSCSSLSKTYAVTGWRLGYVIAPPEISAAVRKVHDFLTVGAPAPLQEAAVTALRFPLAYYRQLQAEYTQRRDLFLAHLARAGLAHNQPQGAYYVLIDISPFGFSDDTAFCQWLARTIGVAAVPGSSFFAAQPGTLPVTQLARLNFAKRAETLNAVGERLLRLKERL
jgi:aspartate/methionine/tyrosine aminotransferase